MFILNVINDEFTEKFHNIDRKKTIKVMKGIVRDAGAAIISRKRKR